MTGLDVRARFPFSLAVLAATLAILALPGVAAATTITVDGSLVDWGVSVKDGNQSNFNTSLPLAGSYTEDQDDYSGHNFFLDPNQGGQDYDAEWMGVYVEDGRIFIAGSTGQRPDNGYSFFGPGDIRLVAADGTVYGIEFGGGPGGYTGGGAIVEGAPGTTYSLNSSGVTTGHTQAMYGHVAGSVWKDGVWINDPIAPQNPTQYQLSGGTYIGMADYAYSGNTLTSQHAMFELSIDQLLFGDDTIIGIYWRPSCGNDELNVTGLNIAPVPEPGTLVLGVLGGLLALALRPRRRAPGSGR